ncbi:nitrate ABC transporter substrate-binding protein [Terrihabitans soli]|uniref:Nitrate ABC transporter substrate-binding protein n=1 Tax=Terrihabitans soli TaxID=708113 RepID=A0A6S6QU91_9HYPH|nr:ABC transporter substrate-binding protein [Terrihabitans soli]BCJ90520.1 nitrate ABC transporter substrate-binding protein [Terrihabitans soli]
MSTRAWFSTAARLTAAAALFWTFTAPASAADKIRVAFGDIASVESLNLLIAFERAKERGVDVEATFFKSEDLAAQAVVGGQADVGIGTPYALIQKVKAPIRLFYQVSNLRFYPVVNTEFYKDWKDLDGQEFAVHSRGSGTEAIMNLMAQKHGIKFSQYSYVPGAEVRAGALLKGNVKATIVDSGALRMLKDKGGDKFKTLDMGNVNATDEALYANTAFLEKNADAINILVEELIKTTRELNKDPKAVVALRTKYKLLPDLPKDLEAEVEPYFADAVEAKLYPADGGSAAAVRSDFEFYTVSGALQGDAGSLKAEDFWILGPVEKARATLGG